MYVSRWELLHPHIHTNTHTHFFFKNSLSNVKSRSFDIGSKTYIKRRIVPVFYVSNKPCAYLFCIWKIQYFTFSIYRFYWGFCSLANIIIPFCILFYFSFAIEFSFKAKSDSCTHTRSPFSSMSQSMNRYKIAQIYWFWFIFFGLSFPFHQCRFDSISDLKRTPMTTTTNVVLII